MDVYNKNRDQNNSLHDEIREQNAKLKNAPFREKLAYFREYYLKMTIAAIVVAVFAISILHTILSAPEDTAFAAFFFNNIGDYSNTELIDGFVEYTGIDTKKHDAYIDASLSYSADEANFEAYIGIEKAMAVISVNELDVIVGDSEVIDYFFKSECLHDITTVLPEDLLETFQDKLYYAQADESKEKIPVGIYVTDSPKLNKYYHYADKEPILSFIINSDSMDNAIAFLRYIYME